MKVQMLVDWKIDGKPRKKGEVVEVNADLGNSLIAGRIAGNPKKAAPVEEEDAKTEAPVPAVKGSRKAKQ